MTIASLVGLNLLFFGIAYFAVARLSGGMLPKPIRVRNVDGRRRGQL